MSPLPVFHVHLTGPRRIRAAGFTLVELLVAVAVFALLATASVTLLAHVLDQRAVVSAQSARLAQLQRTHALLGADLSQVALRRVRRADGRSQRSAFMAAPAGTPVTLSAPSAATASVATSAESIPPDSPSTTLEKPVFRQ